MGRPVEIIAAYQEEGQDEGEYEDDHSGDDKTENTEQSAQRYHASKYKYTLTWQYLRY